MAETKKTETPKEKMVKIRIPRTRADEGDVPVWINDRSWLIKRGVEVEVPECVAELIRCREEMREKRFLKEEAAKNKNK